jgi:hypothetical protein
MKKYTRAEIRAVLLGNVNMGSAACVKTKQELDCLTAKPGDLSLLISP